MDNQIVNELKKSIQYRQKHWDVIERFKWAIIDYFIEKYGFHVRVHTFVDSFGIEKDWSYYRNSPFSKESHFKFTCRVLCDFCEEFDCEFLHTVNDNRYIFTFEDVDMKRAFW